MAGGRAGRERAPSGDVHGAPRTRRCADAAGAARRDRGPGERRAVGRRRRVRGARGRGPRRPHGRGVHASALALYGGELLPEDRFEDWAQARRDQLRETQLALLVELAALQTERGERVDAVATLQRAIVEDPLHEAAHRELMRLFAEDGRGQQALAQYQQLRDVLRRELVRRPRPADPRPVPRDPRRPARVSGPEQPAAPADGLRRARARAGGARTAAGRRPAAHAHRPRRLRQDAALAGARRAGTTRSAHGSSSWPRSATRRWSPARRPRRSGSTCAPRRTRSPRSSARSATRTSCSCSTTAST